MMYMHTESFSMDRICVLSLLAYIALLNIVRFIEVISSITVEITTETTSISRIEARAKHE